MTQEWCLYIVDFLPMMVVAVEFLWIHPSQINAWAAGRSCDKCLGVAEAVSDFRECIARPCALGVARSFEVVA